MKSMENLLNKNNPENTIVRVVFRGSDGKEYECAGVLIKEEDDMIHVAFNAVDDAVKDYLDIQKRNILNIQIVNPEQIEKL